MNNTGKMDDRSITTQTKIVSSLFKKQKRNNRRTLIFAGNKYNPVANRE